MADDVPKYEPHLLSDADRDSLRNVIDIVRNDNGWATRLERALDSEHYWRKRASKPTADDSELQGELDLVKAERDDARSDVVVLRQWQTDMLGDYATLADALTAERAKVAELQSELSDARREAEAARLFVETQTAAAVYRAEKSQLEPVGWLCRETAGQYIHHCDEPPMFRNGMFSSEGHKMSYPGGMQDSIPLGSRARIYLGPAEPLEVTP